MPVPSPIGMARQPFVAHPLAAATITATETLGPYVNDGMLGMAACDIHVANAPTGTTPQIAAQQQVSPDGGTTWYNVGSPVDITAAGSFRVANQAPEALVQFVLTVTGTTPSFTGVDAYVLLS